MKKISVYFLTIVLSILFLGNSNNPPNGYTGAPGDSMCSSCHNQGGSGNINGSLEILGLPSSINAGQTYTITLKINNTSSPLSLAVRGGFQLVALDQSNSNVGTFSSPSSNSTLTSSGGKIYWEHSPFKNFSGGSSLSWTVNWQAPANAQGQMVTLYSAAILANGNSSSSGDLMVSSQASGSLPGPPPLSASISNSKNVSCFDGNDGSISVTAMNGLPPYNFDWSNGQTSATANGLSAGNYSVTVSDQLGASVVLNRLVTQPGLIQINGNGRLVLNCAEDSNGFINLTVSGGVTPYSYSWSTGQRIRDISNLRKGDYTVTVKDNNQCEQVQQFLIEEPDPLQLIPKVESFPDCIKAQNGEIDLKVSGGISPYNYKWNSGETSSRISGKRSDLYLCQVSDRNSCTRSISVNLPVLDTIKPEVIPSPEVNIYLDHNGKAYITDTLFLKNIRDNCDTGITITPVLDSLDCSSIGSRTLLLYVHDLAGNMDSGFVQIRLLDTFPPVPSGWKDSTTSRCDLLVPQLFASDNCGIREIRKLSGPDEGSYFPIGESQMKYEIEDLAGNTLPYEYKVNVLNPLNFEVDTVILDRCTGKDPILILQMSHLSDSTYSLYYNDSLLAQYDTITIDTLFGIPSSQFILTLRDSFQCFKKLDISIPFNESLIRLDSFSIFDASNCNASDGEIELNLSGKIFQGIWVDLNNQPIPNQTGKNLPPGKYFFRVLSHEESDPDVCIFLFGPFEISCPSSNKSNNDLLPRFEIYPNPSSDGHLELIIQGSETVKIKITDMKGQVVFCP